jgi:signal transduction histidine kinase
MDDMGQSDEPVGRRRSLLSPPFAHITGTELLLPAVLLVAQLSGAAATVGGQHGASGRLGPAGWLLVVVGPVALVFRRRSPVAVLWVTLAATLSPWNAAWPANLSLIAAFFVAATGGHRRAGWIVIAAGYVTAVWFDPLAFGHKTASLAFALGLAGWLAVLVIAAEVVRLRRERNDTARTTRELDTRRRASEERLAMARDLHDVIGHNVSLINVQAAVALDLMDHQPEQARVALTAIESASRDVLDELRAMLGAFRSPGDKAPRAPAPSLARVDELVEVTRAAGMTVEVEVVGEPRQLPAAIDLAGYRVVQESLTNAVRHAGRAPTHIRLTYTTDGVDIDVTDDGPSVAGNGPGRPGAGSGIAGMHERVTALGGRFRAAPRPSGGFAVSAHLPLGDPS